MTGGFYLYIYVDARHRVKPSFQVSPHPASGRMVKICIVLKQSCDVVQSKAYCLNFTQKEWCSPCTAPKMILLVTFLNPS